MELHKTLQQQIETILPPHLRDAPEMQHLFELISKNFPPYENASKLATKDNSKNEVLTLPLSASTEQQTQQERQIARIKNLIFSMDSELGKENPDDYDLEFAVNFLERRVAEFNMLEVMAREAITSAENSVKVKSNFLSVMSHEIRTPLNAIIGSIHILKQEEHLPSQETYIKSLQISADNLLNLINDILDFNKIEEGKITFAKQDINLRTLLNNIRLANFFKASERGNKIKIMFDEEIPDFVVGDEVRLAQILNNLISNAIKFTTQGLVQIEIQVEESKGNQLKINFSIKDTGIGIDTKMKEQIFERFTQADSNINREYGGSGLGLTIVRRLLQLQKSDINVDSDLGKGSRFYFTLTFGTSSKIEPDDNIYEIEDQNLKQIQILLVEDVEFNVLIARKMLTSWNAHVDVANNGEIAVEKFKNNKYDIILMDLQMPIMDGISATKVIRSLGGTLPIIALTASASHEVQMNVKQAGMTGYVSKPFNPDDLYNTIKKYVIQA